MNTMKTLLLMALLTGIMVAVGGAVGGSSGASLMLVISLAMNFGTYWFSAPMVLRSYGAQEIAREDAPELYGLIETLAQRAGLPMPTVAVIESDVPNAFATGRNPEHAAVAVTTGILRVLNYEELSGVLAHELTHVKNRDILTSSIAAAMAGVISWTAQMAFFFGGRSDDDDGGGLAGLVTILLAPIAAGLIQMAISRSREYAADEGGGSLCGNPRYLAKALEKLDYYAKHGETMQDATPATAHMFIINPFEGVGSKIANLYSTHPATEDRIARLNEQARRIGR
ncbi:zinc metalloprotease HtpX [uncultured Selenomonas sp.]|uniref:zinc metalloprotease HtpX n=2 Tax=uncultured Selenomonas sp. TaxID=159275 RepID=UPI0025F4C59C|nr:zinc metalloprotease HtpX [uncultured Selenomonas sp.]